VPALMQRRLTRFAIRPFYKCRNPKFSKKIA
jgi:hypothetical protein